MSKIEQLIGEIEEYIDGCKLQPFTSTKIIVDKAQLEELLTELRHRTPDEIKKYQKILNNKEAIIADARSQADSMIAQAQAERDRIVNNNDIIQAAYNKANDIINQANAQAQEIVNKAVEDANSIREGSIAYTDDQLNNLEIILSSALENAQSRYEGLMSVLRSSYDIVRENRRELHPSQEPVMEEMPVNEDTDPSQNA